MPRRNDIKKILIIGSGPIVIGQACEFDYSGAQACKALKKDGYEIVLINSNPATIMTDPEIADHTYIEPITWQNVAKIIEIENPDALLSTMGGQTALNCALELEANQILKRHNVELIGANSDAIKKAEDRELFRKAMQKIEIDVPRSRVVNNICDAWSIQKKLGFPVVIRPSFTLGGSGGGIAHDPDEFIRICTRGIELSPTNEILIEESLLGWKEYELEVIRDKKDSCIIVCTIENIDPMGVHTGDSITVAPAQTLTDVEYQNLRRAAIKILREIGVETGGSNVQFAVNPKTGRFIVIEMNPRVSRSSALASKATGFPIAKIAALLAVGYTLDELRSDVTGGVIPASFEPTLDYVVVKMPRFDFSKFPGCKRELSTQMKAVGEVMSIGANFKSALQKAICSLENGFNGFVEMNSVDIHQDISIPSDKRLLYVGEAFRRGISIDDVCSLTNIDVWFLQQIYEIINTEKTVHLDGLENLLLLKQQGFSDARIAKLCGVSESEIAKIRADRNIFPRYKRIDSCAAEFPASTAYMYSTYEGFCEAGVEDKSKVVVISSGPNRIGQGIEFDYCCVQGVNQLKIMGIEAIMINCNPGTVSTDYDTSDKLYFEPLNFESVLEIIKLEKPLGVILQFGGQTPLKLASELHNYGVKILGTSFDSIDLVEDRGRFVNLIKNLKLVQPESYMVENREQAIDAASKIGYPIIVRPSYVIGGLGMKVVQNEGELAQYDQPILIDKFLESAIELDVDAIADSSGNVVVAGILEHIEPAGVHSGDSTAVFPPFRISNKIINEIIRQMTLIAKELKVVGLINTQFAVQDDIVYVIEVNPRASRTIPFISKTIGVSLSKLAVACILGKSLPELGFTSSKWPDFTAVKMSAFPFNKFPEIEVMLGPEMKSTGEAMGIGKSLAEALLKAKLAVGHACNFTEENVNVVGLMPDANEVGVYKLQDLHQSKVLEFTYE